MKHILNSIFTLRSRQCTVMSHEGSKLVFVKYMYSQYEALHACQFGNTILVIIV